ncbi:ornithine cyclodeaminase family protein [Natrialbaceae archaeon A-arb3/5]
MGNEVLYLSGEELVGLADPEEYVEVVEKGFEFRGNGDPATSPSRIANEDSLITSYTVMFPEWNVMGGYMYSVGEDVWYTTPLFEAETGRLLAILDGAVWNPYKTGSVGAVGTDVLAKEDASTVGVVGSAQISRATLTTTATVRDLEDVKVFSPTESSRESFASEMDEELDADVRAVESSDEAISEVDIVIVATDAGSPVIDGEQLSPGTHINAMGAAHPKRELDIATFERVDKYVPDIRSRVFGHSVQERFRSASGFLAAFDEHAVSESTIHAELGQIVAGNVPGRTDDEEITVVDSVGTGIETVACANMLYEKATEKGLGTSITNVPRHESYDL